MLNFIFDKDIELVCTYSECFFFFLHEIGPNLWKPKLLGSVCRLLIMMVVNLMHKAFSLAHEVLPNGRAFTSEPFFISYTPLCLALL